jgi:hypothetical protein
MTSGYLRGSNNLLAGASAQGGYTIENSLRFRASASAYLNRTPASAGNRKTWTWSGWFKRGASGDGTGSNHYFLFSATDGNSTQCDFYVNTIRVYFNGGTYLLQTTQLFRDYSAWYHIVVSVDTTQATASNRVKIYINGVQVTSFSTASYPTQNLDSAINGANSHYINFGQRPFAYTPPTGFLPCTRVTYLTAQLWMGVSIFNAVLYTGNGLQQIRNTSLLLVLDFQPDFVWIKATAVGRQPFFTRFCAWKYKSSLFNTNQAASTEQIVTSLRRWF